MGVARVCLKDLYQTRRARLRFPLPGVEGGAGRPGQVFFKKTYAALEMSGPAC